MVLLAYKLGNGQGGDRSSRYSMAGAFEDAAVFCLVLCSRSRDVAVVLKNTVKFNVESLANNYFNHPVAMPEIGF
jgi:hypothetical protein